MENKGTVENSKFYVAPRAAIYSYWRRVAPSKYGEVEQLWNLQLYIRFIETLFAWMFNGKKCGVWALIDEELAEHLLVHNTHDAKQWNFPSHWNSKTWRVRQGNGYFVGDMDNKEEGYTRGDFSESDVHI
jgi:hypothetical protein